MAFHVPSVRRFPGMATINPPNSQHDFWKSRVVKENTLNKVRTTFRNLRNRSVDETTSKKGRQGRTGRTASYRK